MNRGKGPGKLGPFLHWSDMTKEMFDNLIKDARWCLLTLENCQTANPDTYKNEHVASMLRISHELLNIGAATAAFIKEGMPSRDPSNTRQLRNRPRSTGKRPSTR